MLFGQFTFSQHCSFKGSRTALTFHDFIACTTAESKPLKRGDKSEFDERRRSSSSHTPLIGETPALNASILRSATVNALYKHMTVSAPQNKKKATSGGAKTYVKMNYVSCSVENLISGSMKSCFRRSVTERSGKQKEKASDKERSERMRHKIQNRKPDNATTLYQRETRQANNKTSKKAKPRKRASWRTAPFEQVRR